MKINLLFKKAVKTRLHVSLKQALKKPINSLKRKANKKALSKNSLLSKKHELQWCTQSRGPL